VTDRKPGMYETKSEALLALGPVVVVGALFIGAIVYAVLKMTAA